MNKTRRLVTQAVLALGGITAALRIWRGPRAAPASAFAAHDVDGALQDLFGATQTDLVASGKIKLSIPDVAENGAIVPLTVAADLNGVEQIAILAADNPHPLTSSYAIPAGTLPYVSTRIKMGGSADVLAVVKTSGRLYSTRKHVKVSVGGCS
ncbi:MAG: thiosulfate oxidation carrier protein SoxY [Gammaproteobacteria bacterium]